MIKNAGLKRRIAFAALSSTLILPVRATTFIPQSEGKMIRDAQIICATETLDLKFERVTSTVVTKAMVKPLECFKGNLKKEFFVKWPGGSYKQDGKIYHVSVPGTPHLKKGSLAILYLWRSSELDDFTVLSWTNGVVPLTRTATNELVISKGGVTPKSVSAKDSKTSKKNTSSSYESLTNYRKRVEQILNSSKPER